MMDLRDQPDLKESEVLQVCQDFQELQVSPVSRGRMDPQAPEESPAATGPKVNQVILALEGSLELLVYWVHQVYLELRVTPVT